MLNDAMFVLSKSKLLEQFNKLKQVSDFIFYSAKTNYEVGKLLEELTDCFFSIHSLESLEKINDKKRVLFLAQAWNEKELDILFNKGITNFVVDNERDLNILLNYINKKSLTSNKLNLFLRMRMKENTVKTGKYFVYGMFSDKINELIPELRKNKRINKLGIHFHRKSQNISEWNLKEELEDVLNSEVFENIDMLNIGGGLPIKYKNFSGQTIDHIFSEIKKLKQWLNNKNIKLIIEPGRFLAGPPIKLITEIKNIYNNNIIINASVYNTMMDTFVSGLRLEVEGELESGVPYTIKGCTPCSMDIFRYRVYLENPKIGDKLIFLNAGAYNFSSDFCNLKKLKTEVVD